LGASLDTTAGCAAAARSDANSSAAGGNAVALLLESLAQLRDHAFARLLELFRFAACALLLRSLDFELALRRRQLARLGGALGALLLDGLAILRSSGRLLLSQRRDLCHGRRLLPLKFEPLRALRRLRLPELARLLAGLAQLCRLRLDLAPRRRQLGRQCGTLSAFLVEGLAMLRHGRGQRLPRGRGLGDGGGLLSLLLLGLRGPCGVGLPELPHVLPYLAQLRRLRRSLALRGRQLLCESGNLLPLLLQRLGTRCGRELLELFNVVVCAPQLRRLRLQFALRGRQLIGQCGALRTLAIECLTMLGYRCNQLLTRSCGFLRQGRCLVLLLSQGLFVPAGVGL
jgi:hypothetical protein